MPNNASQQPTLLKILRTDDNIKASMQNHFSRGFPPSLTSIADVTLRLSDNTKTSTQNLPRAITYADPENAIAYLRNSIANHPKAIANPRDALAIPP